MRDPSYTRIFNAADLHPLLQPVEESPVNQNPLQRLLGSTKAIVTLLVIVCSFTALFLGRATWEQVVTLLQVSIPAWLAAQAIEDGAQKLAVPRMDAVKEVATSVATDVVQNSLRPPPVPRDS